MSHCLTETELLAFLESDDDAPGIDLFIAHLETCDICQARLDELATASADPLIKTGNLAAHRQPLGREPFETDSPWVHSLPNYHIVRKIGQGGMGEVFECRDVRLNRRVAVKTLKAENIKPELMERHRREAMFQAGLNHPNIVMVYDFEFSQAGFPYLVMELIDGFTLAGLIRDRSLVTHQTIHIMNQVARAVAFSHDHKILHRDLKPSNILLTKNHRNQQPSEDKSAPGNAEIWTAKITDFGLARLLGPSPELTLSQAIMGTPAYLAPECVNSNIGKPGVASDIYALGVILYECLTGRPPFWSENVGETIRMIQEAEPVSPRTLSPSLPRDLETICLKCLDKQPTQRYASAAALASDLDLLAKGLPILARPLSRFDKITRWCARNQRLAVAIFIMCLSWLALGLGGYWFAYKQAELRRLADDRAAEAKLAEQKAINQSDLARNNFMSSLYLSSDIVKNLSKLEGLENPGPAITPLRQKLESRISNTATTYLNDAKNQLDHDNVDLEQLFKNAMQVRALGLVAPTTPVFERLIELAKRSRPTDNDHGERISVGMKSATILALTCRNQNDPAKALAILADAWRQWPINTVDSPGLPEAAIRDRLILGTTYQGMLNQASRQTDAQALAPTLHALQQAMNAKKRQD